MIEQKNKETLMEALEKAGYPREEMFNHCSDLYVYATPLTKRIIKRWFKFEDLEEYHNYFDTHVTCVNHKAVYEAYLAKELEDFADGTGFEVEF